MSETQDDRGAQAPGRQTGLRPLTDGRLRFACHPAVPCFNRCCADLHLVLTPYDILRMKARLGLSAREFLETHTREASEGGGLFPLLRLRMGEGGARPCPFVTPKGCAIYEDRPGACRLYPLGRAATCAVPGLGEQEKYFVVDEPHCRGFEEGTEWSVAAWIRDQGVALYNAMNRPWMEIVTSRSLKLRDLDGAKLQMFYMTSYNLDRFRDFVFQSPFIGRLGIAREEAERAAVDDVALMLLGMRWLKFALLGEDTLPRAR